MPAFWWRLDLGLRQLVPEHLPVNVPRLWNALQEDIRAAKSISGLRSDIKTFWWHDHFVPGRANVMGWAVNWERCYVTGTGKRTNHRLKKKEKRNTILQVTISFYAVFYHLGVGKRKAGGIIATCMDSHLPVQMSYNQEFTFGWPLTQTVCLSEGVREHRTFPQTSVRVTTPFIQTYKIYRITCLIAFSL